MTHELRRMADVDGELLAALTATVAFMELLVRQRSDLIALLASGARPTPEQLAELRARHEADERELDRFVQRFAPLA